MFERSGKVKNWKRKHEDIGHLLCLSSIHSPRGRGENGLKRGVNVFLADSYLYWTGHSLQAA